MTQARRNRLDRRTLLKSAAASTVGLLAAPMIARSENKSIKIGMSTINSLAASPNSVRPRAMR